jgi:hypothetical protein
LILYGEGINKSIPKGNLEEIQELEKEHEKLYNKALILKEDPGSSEYQNIKSELFLNIEKRKQLVRG